MLLQELLLLMLLTLVLHRLHGRSGGACCFWRKKGLPVPQVRERICRARRRPAAVAAAAAASAAVDAMQPAPVLRGSPPACYPLTAKEVSCEPAHIYVAALMLGDTKGPEPS